MARTRKRRGISWELVGIVAILGVFIVGGLYWISSSGGEGELTAPTFTALDPGDTMEVGQTEDGRPYMGSAEAPVAIYEFADFQCPHCRDFSRAGAMDVKRDLLANGEAKLVWVNFPILGPESTNAAKGAVCATEQGQFWTFHDWLFANQPARSNSGSFSNERLVEMAAMIPEMDAAAFEECLGSSETADKVQADQDFGNEHGVGQTPSFLVGDTVVTDGTLQGISDAVAAAGG